MALTIFSPDPLRKQVEAASGGVNTVHYTAKGQPSYFYVMDSVKIGGHSAFNVAKTDGTGNLTKTELFIGMYTGVVRDSELLSIPGVNPSASYGDMDSYITAAFNCNNGTTITGFHAANNIEWAAIQKMCISNGFYPNGNTDYGRSSDNALERGVDSVTGRKVLASGTITSSTLTGSGPSSWRHDGSPFGISDLNGNVWEWAPGLRINNGEVNFISIDGVTIANPALCDKTFFYAASNKWYAIDGATGNLVPAILGTPVLTNVQISSLSSGTVDFTLYGGSVFNSMVATSSGTNPVSGAALTKCKEIGVFPVTPGIPGGDGFWLNPGIEACAIRGGDWNNTSLSGVFALNCTLSRGHVSPGLSARVALTL